MFIAILTKLTNVISVVQGYTIININDPLCKHVVRHRKQLLGEAVPHYATLAQWAVPMDILEEFDENLFYFVLLYSSFYVI